MDAILNITEGESSQIDVNNIDHEKLRSFQAKCTVWDFYDMTKEEYSNKLPTEKQDLIISYYQNMVQGMLLLFVICNLKTKILVSIFYFWKLFCLIYCFVY